MMISSKKKLVDILLKKFDAKVQYNGVWYNISCPFCGDSPNPNTRHCNIRVSPDDDVVVVHCFQLKCHSSGIMNKKHLRDMGIYDKEITDFITNNHSRSQELMKQNIETVQGFTLPLEASDEISKYFYNRTRLNLDSDTIYKFRIVTDLKKFIEMNSHLLSKTVVDRINKISATSYIGFLNSTGSILEVRVTDKDIHKDKRFLKVSLTDNDMLRFARHKPYYIERNNEYTLCEDGYIVLCEGKFDLMNTITRIMPDCSGIWIATTVAGMQGCIRSVTKKYPYRRLVIVCDKDVKDTDVQRMIRGIEYRISSCTLVRNKLSKDVGDLSEPIDLERYDINIKGVK